MKKLLAIAFIAVAFAACNGSDTTKETTSDTAVSVVPQPADTVKTVTDTTVTQKTVVEEGQTPDSTK